jgi:hypothetical protein
MLLVSKITYQGRLVYTEEGSGLPLYVVLCSQGEVADLQRFGVLNVAGNEGYDLLAMLVFERHKKCTREF